MRWAEGYDAYYRGEYRESLDIFEKWAIPGFFWSDHALAMNYGQLNMHREAQQAVARLLELYPDWGAHVREEDRKWLWDDQGIEHEIEGLRKAGLEVPEEGK